MSELKCWFKLTENSVSWENIGEEVDGERSEVEDEEREVRNRKVKEPLSQERMADGDAQQMRETKSAYRAESDKKYAEAQKVLERIEAIQN